MINVEQQGGNLKSCEVASGSYGLCSDVLYSLACVEPHSFILTHRQRLDNGDYGGLRNLPDGVGGLIVELCGRVEEKLAQACHGLLADLLVLVLDGLAEEESQATLGHFVADDRRVTDQLPYDRAQTLLQVRALHVFEEFHQQAHKGRVDQPIRNVRIQDDALEVDQDIELVVHSATRGHRVVDLMQVPLDGWRLYGRGDLV